MLHWLVCDGKFSKIVAHHFRLCVCVCVDEVIVRMEMGEKDK